MKKLVYLSSLLFVICYLLFASSVHAVSYPSPSGYVNDFAGLYSADFKTNLETRLSSFDKETGNELAVVTIESLEGDTVEEYAVRLFEKWKIGKKSEDNGLLLLIAKQDRKIRIEVGYGLEPYINDARAGDIIRQDISPQFKKEDYEKGTENAVNSLTKYIGNKEIVETAAPSGDSNVWAIFPLIFLIFMVITYLASFLGRTKKIWPGGVIGGIFGGIIGLIVGSFLLLVMFSVFSALFGLFMDFILSRNYKVRKKKGLPTGFFHTWGGFSGGGKGSGGGGFGGFGGGSSGGGGASGGW